MEIDMREKPAGKSGDINHGRSGNPLTDGDQEESVDIDFSREAVMARIQESEQKEQFGPIQIPGWSILAVLAVIGIGIWYWYHCLDAVKIPLCVVNTSSDAPLEIRLDGKLIGHASKMIGEDPKAAVMAELDEGEHEIEARDKSGAVIRKERFILNLNKKTHGFKWKFMTDTGASYENGEAFGFLWLPLPDINTRFFLQTSFYGEGAVPGYDTQLSTSNTLKPFPKLVSFWFRNNPSGVSVPKGWKSTSETALRRGN